MNNLLSKELISANILIVDDTPANLHILADILKSRGYTARPVTSGKRALQAIQIEPPDLILLDINMPEMDGYDVCRAIKANENISEIPVIFISAMSETPNIIKAFEAGGVDYITKPFKVDEVFARVDVHLKLRMLQLKLEGIIKDQVKEISDAQLATIFAMAKLAESRDDETGRHLDRVRQFCKLLALQLGIHSAYCAQITDAFTENIFNASPLHDIGKVGIPDKILLKPGKLTPSEFEKMKMHTILGSKTLEAVTSQYPRNPLVKMGIEIARSHHERWDGSGYPDGLAGLNIPLSARIMAVADVYDALRSVRVYKPAFSEEKTVEIIAQSSGSHLDPVIVEAFQEIQDNIHRAYQILLDSDADNQTGS